MPEQSSVLFSNTIRLWAGAERFVLDAAVGLYQRGHRVIVQSYPGMPLLLRAKETGLETIATRVHTDAAPWTVLPLAARLRRDPVDVVWTTRDKDLRTTGLAARLSARKIAVVHSRECDDPVKSSSTYRWFFTRVAHRVVVNSESTRHTTLNSAPWLDPGHVDLLLKGIDLTPWEQAQPGDWPQRFRKQPSEVIVGYAGQLVPRKRVDLLMSLLATEPLRGKPWKLVLAGQGPAQDELKTLAATLGIAERVIFCDFVEDLPAWMAAIDFLVLPSLIEGFGYVLAEAMAASKPVAAYAASSIPEVVREGVGGLLAPPQDDEALAPILLRMIDDGALRARLGEEGHRDTAGRLSLDVMIDRMEEILLRAAGNARGEGQSN